MACLCARTHKSGPVVVYLGCNDDFNLRLPVTLKCVAVNMPLARLEVYSTVEVHDIRAALTLSYSGHPALRMTRLIPLAKLCSLYAWRSRSATAGVISSRVVASAEQ